MSKKNGLVGGISLGVIMVIALIVMGLCLERVPAGYVGVQYDMNGGVREEVLTQGWHMVRPGIKVTLYTVGIEQSYLTAGEDGDSKGDESFSASSKEGKALQIDLTFTYQYDAKDVTKVFTQFKGQSGQGVRDSFIKPNIISWTKEIIAKYPVTDILGAEKANVNIALTEYLSEKFKPYGITVSNVSLINIGVDKDTRTAINNKIKAQQDAETQAINNQIAIDKAEADAKAKLTAAQAEADAQLIEAKAEAEANDLLTKSLSNTILNSKWIEKWNGELPLYLTDGKNSVMLNLDKNTNTPAPTTTEAPAEE